MSSDSPRTVMMLAHELAGVVLPDYASKFSRHDFTLAHLFACLVVRQMLKLSYRATEKLLNDTDWCQQLGMKGVPDHTTLCRASKHILTTTNFADMLDAFTQAKLIKGMMGKQAAMDSTHFESHRRSRHYERRKAQGSYAGAKKRKKPANTGRSNASRSRVVRRIPKLGLCVDTRSHLICSARPRTGAGSDAPDFGGLLFDAWKRSRLNEVLADAGYDSEANHRRARLDMNVRSRIKAGVGRPTTKPAAGYYRRLMQRQLQGSQAGKPYGQRAQVECVISMLKRNLSESLTARSTHGRKMELLLKTITHNLMIALWPEVRVATEPVVAIFGQYVLWFNDIEWGFNLSRYSTFGKIDEYCCSQDELQHSMYQIQRLMQAGTFPGRFGPPQPLNTGGDGDK